MGDDSLDSDGFEFLEESQDVSNTRRLLNAIDRIRDERDTLRGRMDFLQLECRFRVEALEKELGEKRDHYGRTMVASALVIQNLHSERDTYLTRLDSMSQALTDARARYEAAEKLAQDREELIANLQKEAAVMQERAYDSGTQMASAEARISELTTMAGHLEQEVQAERTSHEETGVALSQTEAQLTEATKSLEEVESERDSLSLQVTHLKQDLDFAKQELEEAESRYSTLQATQLSAMSSSQATRALRSQIEELEGRILRRTEQIGIHQHDIKRLETNLRLQEERVAEMANEMEVLESEKHAMVEDCMTTREERDDALRRCEELEDSVEVLEQRCAHIEERRDNEVQSLVEVVMRGVSTRRRASTGFLASMSRQKARESHLFAQIHDSNAAKGHALERISQLVHEHGIAVRIAEEKSSLVRFMDQERLSAVDETRQAIISLAVIHVGLCSTTSQLHTAKHGQALLQAQIDSLHLDLSSKIDELAALRVQHESLLVQADESKAQDETRFTARIAELETKWQNLEQAHAAIQVKYQTAADELTVAHEQIRMNLSSSQERAQAEETVLSELEQLRTRHAEETCSLQLELSRVNAELETARQHQADSESAHEHVLGELRRSREEAERRLADMVEKLQAGERAEGELAELHARYSTKIRDLQERLEQTSTEMKKTAAEQDERAKRHQQTVDELNARLTVASESLHAKHDLDHELAKLREQHAESVGRLQERLDIAEKELHATRQSRAELEESHRQAEQSLIESRDDLESRLTRLTTEADEVRRELEQELEKHIRDEERHAEELRIAVARGEDAESAHAHLQENLATVRAQLLQTDSALHALQDEKQNMQAEMTRLEAEIQRSLSLQRFQESQIRDSERDIALLKAEAERIRANYIESEKVGKTAEINLALQSAQNEKIISSLRREINSLRENSKLEESVTELKEKNEEMEALLKAKCLEIEENDDRFIEMLKEKKKLTSKVEALTRKVNNLQGKLATATSIIPSEAGPSSQRASSPSSATPPLLPPTHTLAPAQPAAAYPSTTPNMFSRSSSAMSASLRPKTPEPRVPPPVFKARTPEAKRMPVQPPQEPLPSASTSSSIGKKRRAPDDFDDCESVPPQGFTSDSIPSRFSEGVTPRVRKALHTVRSGFTPVRHAARHTPTQASPVRRATTSAAGMPPVISDVTNSPRGPSHADQDAAKAGKRGWLGKIRGGASSGRSVTTSSRPVVFERMQNGGPS